MPKKKTRTKSKAKAKPSAISLKNTVSELRKAHGALKKVHDKAEGPEKEELALKVKTLTDIHERLVEACHGNFVLVPPSGAASKVKS
jgi:hypothetical protein